MKIVIVELSDFIKVVDTDIKLETIKTMINKYRYALRKSPLYFSTENKKEYKEQLKEYINSGSNSIFFDSALN